ncbi:MAG: hypothetical protein H7X78_05495 [Methyloceanibacter sp.]|jgi:Trp operon repressor|nr:hypothetical protein [Methyloceanibacter sp.]
MLDIRGELRERAYMVQHLINVEHTQFEQMLLQLKTEQDQRLEALKAQLRAVNKLIDVAAWQYNVRTALTLSIAVAAAAETSAAAIAASSNADGPRSVMPAGAIGPPGVTMP